MLVIIVTVLGLLADQISKYWAMTSLKSAPGGKIDLVPGVFRFSYVENRGAAFGLLQGKQWFFFVMTILVVAAIVVFLIKKRGKMGRFFQVAAGLMLTGAIGNFIDRVWLGYVRDMFDFYLFDFWKWVFNVADACLVISIIMILIYAFWIEPKLEQKILFATEPQKTAGKRAEAKLDAPEQAAGEKDEEAEAQLEENDA